MSVATLESMGLAVTLVAGQIKLAGLDKLAKDDAARAVALAREHKADLVAALAVEAPHGELRPCRENCAPRGCCAWVSNSRLDRLITWRCLGSILIGGETVEDADLPPLQLLGSCPWFQLEGGGRHGR